MSTSKKPKGHEKKEFSVVRSSAAEYLTFVAATGDNELTRETAALKFLLATFDYQ